MTQQPFMVTTRTMITADAHGGYRHTKASSEPAQRKARSPAPTPRKRSPPPSVSPLPTPRSPPTERVVPEPEVKQPEVQRVRMEAVREVKEVRDSEVQAEIRANLVVRDSEIRANLVVR